MNPVRRKILSIGATAAAGCTVCWPASAGAYPDKPIRVIVGFPPGGGADLITRLVCDGLQRRLGQAVLVENRPGAATNVATEAVVRSPADGYTLLATTTSNLLNGALFEDLRFDFMRDIAPVAAISVQPLVLEAGPTAQTRTLRQFVEHAKAQPGKLTVGHTGNGTISHLAAELLKLQAGLDFLTVPYRGSAPMLTDLLGGRIDAAFDNIPASLEHLRSGRLHALAVSTAGRSDFLPGTPAVAEQFPGFEAYAVAGLGAPKGTPSDIVELLNAQVNAAIADPLTGERLSGFGVTATPGTPADFGRRIAAETEKWAGLIRRAGIRLT